MASGKDVLFAGATRPSLVWASSWMNTTNLCRMIFVFHGWIDFQQGIAFLKPLHLAMLTSSPVT